MKTSSKCVSCFFAQIEKTASIINISEKKKKEIYKLLAKKLSRFDFSLPPVVFGRVIYKSISAVTGVSDPFLTQKREIEKYLIALYSRIRTIIERDKDSFYRAAKLCAAANAIDFGAGKKPDIPSIVKNLRNERLIVNHFKEFKYKLKAAREVLVLGDNCGEIFFDRFFIEYLKKYNDKVNVVYAVRPSPMINDALLVDAKKAGIDLFAKVISSGCDYPGLILGKTSKVFNECYRRADIVISKGQGNFEAYEDKKKDVFYIFKAKCRPVSDFLGLPLNSLLFLYNQKMI